MGHNTLAMIFGDLVAVPIVLVEKPFERAGYYCRLTNHLADSPGELEPGILALFGPGFSGSQPYLTRVYNPKNLRLLVLGVDLR